MALIQKIAPTRSASWKCLAIAEILCSAKRLKTYRGADGVFTPYKVRSSVLCWRPVLLRLAPRVQRSNKNTRKQRAVSNKRGLRGEGEVVGSAQD